MSGIVKPQIGVRLQRGHPLADGLVGAWLMHEGSGTKVYDAAGNGLTGSLVDAVSWADSVYGHALDIAGSNDYVQITNSPVLDVGGQVSLAAWFIPDTVALEQAIVWKNRNSSLTQSFALRISSGVVQGNIYTGAADVIDGGTSLVVGTPYCAVETYDGEYLRLYLNGIQDASPVAASGAVTYDVGDLYFGIRENLDYDYNGRIALVYLWNRGLSDEEVASIAAFPYQMFDQPRLYWMGAALDKRANVSLPKPKPGVSARLQKGHKLADDLKGAWLLNEGSGGRVHDYSGNGNYGTMSALDPTTAWGGGPAGHMVEFDGDVGASISIGNGPSIVGGGPFTVSALVRNDHTAKSENKTIYDQRDGTTTTSMTLRVNATTGYLLGWCYQATDQWNTTLVGNVDLSDGLWHHVAFTRGIDLYGRLYLDGALHVEQAPTTTARNLVSVHCDIGIDYRDTRWEWEGGIDHVYVWDRALTADEIAVVHAHPYQMFDYRFDPAMFGALGAAGHPALRRLGLLGTGFEFDRTRNTRWG